MDDELFALPLQLDETFIGIDHLLQRNSRLAKDSEGVAVIEIFIESRKVFYRPVTAKLGADEDAAGEIAPPGDEMDRRSGRLQLLQGLTDLFQVLMRQGLIRLDIISSPGEVRRC